MKIKILKEGSKKGRLGKHAWPSADTRYKDPELRPKEPDTDIEEKLYKELHAHFGAILAGVPLSKESIEAIKQILDNGEYPDIFKRCTGDGAVVRGMRVSIEWLKRNAPEALESWTTEKNYDWHDPVKADFEYNSKGSYGSVSSWAGIRFWNKARVFAATRRTNQPANAVSCIIYASCESGLFLNTQAFTKFIGGRYKKEFDIKKLNPQGGKEGEILLLGDCKVNAIQLYGAKPSMAEAADKTIELEPVGQTADDTWNDESAEDKDKEKDATLPPQRTPQYSGPEAVLAGKGFVNITRLGSGMVGNVYSADWHNGLEIAVKVVPKGAIKVDLPDGRSFRWSGEKEIRAYEGIKKAREQSKNIAKHFPEVFAIMPGGDNYYIFMERLTDEGPYAAVIDELFAGIESLVDPGKDLIDHGAFKDPSRRLFMYLKDDKSRNILLDRILVNISPEAREEAKKWAYNWYKWVGADKITQPGTYEMIDELFAGDEKAQDILLDGFGNLQKEFEDNSWMSYVVLKILEVIKQHDLQGFYMNYKNITSQWVDLGRKGAPVGWYHRPPTRKAAFGGVEDDIASVYKEAESIKLALDDLEDIMGLVGTDMHDKNVMMRPMTGDIVIVDVGLFKPREELKEKKQKDVGAEITHWKEKGKPHDQAVAIALNKHKLEEALYDMPFDRSKLTIKNRLNPKIWDKKQIDSEIREKLLQIARDFVKESHIEGKVEDITLTGGNSTYNWHNTSDLDVHLVVDYKRFGEKGEFIKEIMDLERMRWNQDHNVLLYGHEVEIYVQDKLEDHYSDGIFSLEGNRWVTVPLPGEENYSYNTILKKAEAIVEDINAVRRLYEEENYKKAHKQAEKLREKIRNMRSVGLEKDGLWSTENIAFKLLRNSGYLNHLSELYGNSYDNMMSLGGKSTITISILSDIDEKKKKKRKKSKKTGNDKYHWNVSSWHYDGGYGDKGPNAKWTTVKS